MSWLTFAEPADDSMLRKVFARRAGLDSKGMSESAFLCSNPLTGTARGVADASANLGTLAPDFEKESGTLVASAIPARCSKDGLLLIGPPPKLDLGPYVLPVNNYHLYDILLFWANLRADVAQRVEAWQATH